MKMFSKSYLAFLLAIIFVCLILLEVFIRMRTRNLYGFQQGSISELYKYDETSGLRVPIPNAEAKGAKTHIKINSLGFRGHELEKVKQESTIRIAILGASTSFCAEVSDNTNTWPELVKTQLSEKYPSYRFEMINGGVPGYGIASSLINLRKRILPLQPDIVLVYHATNDISYESRRVAITKGIIKRGQKHHGSTLATFLSNHSQAFDLIYKNLIINFRQKNAASSIKLDKLPVEYAAPFLANLDSIRQECERERIPLVLFTFSTKFRRDQTPEVQLKNMNTAMYYMPWMSREAFFTAFDFINYKISAYAQQYQYVFVDTLHNSIPGDDEHFVDSVHFSDQGCLAMAGRVVNALLRENIIPKVIDARKGSEASVLSSDKF